MSLNLKKTSQSSKVVTLYHGSSYQELVPTFGYGEDKHDYGRGLYLTPSRELAKEWAAGNSTTGEAWLHTLELDMAGLTLFDFEAIKKHRALYWVTEVLRHRKPSGVDVGMSRTYLQFLYTAFDARVGTYDVVRGWRADDSYFLISADFVNDQLAVPLLEDALRLGELGIQVCCKSEKAFQHLSVVGTAESVPFEVYRRAYIARDRKGRNAYNDLRNSPANEPSLSLITIRNLYVGWGERNG